MRTTAALMFAGFAVLPLPASARIVTATLKDEIGGTAKHFVSIRGPGFSEYTNRDYIELSCDKDGVPQISHHIGGMYSGMYATYSDSSYKFDNGEVTKGKLDQLNSSQEAFRTFYSKMLSAKRFIIRFDDFESSLSYDLAGFAKAAGPKSPFGRQCAARLAPPA